MRRSLARLSYSSSNRPTFISSSSSAAFSTSAPGGRGRGRGSDFSNFRFTGEDESTTSVDHPSQGLGHGRGRGAPPPSSPIHPPFPSFVDNSAAPPAGRGRGIGYVGPTNPPQQSGPARTPITFVPASEDSLLQPPRVRNPEETHLPSSILNVLSGAGRGKPGKSPPMAAEVPDKPKEENRHMRQRQAPESGGATRRRFGQDEGRTARAGDGREEGGRGGRGGNFKGRDGRGRGMQAWRGRGGGRGWGRGREGGEMLGRFDDDADDDYGAGLYVGDDADGEKLAEKLGPDTMNELAEAFEEMSSRVLPSPLDDAYVDALHTNLLIECEPEYLMGDFEANPDIDEKPPIPLRDFLEKVKPFMMAYEGIQSQQEWEEVVEETMKTVPLLKEIVDYYSGPDRVTAKQQNEELERVAETLPQNAPASVKRFTDRAVLSLQSNPGWGFDKKCQFMDKLVREVSQIYK